MTDTAASAWATLDPDRFRNLVEQAAHQHAGDWAGFRAHLAGWGIDAPDTDELRRAKPHARATMLLAKARMTSRRSETT